VNVARAVLLPRGTDGPPYGYATEGARVNDKVTNRKKTQARKKINLNVSTKD